MSCRYSWTDTSRRLAWASGQQLQALREHVEDRFAGRVDGDGADAGLAVGHDDVFLSRFLELAQERSASMWKASSASRQNFSKYSFKARMPCASC